jgi:hypothetical protein
MSYPTRQTALNQTVVVSWTLVFLSVVLEPNEWVVLSWWNVVLARQFSDIKGFQNTTFAPQCNTIEHK